MTTLILVLIFGFIALFVSRPLWIKGSQTLLLLKEKKTPKRRELREEKATIILALRELDFDYEMGKLSVEDYKNLKKKYEDYAVRIMKELEDAEKIWAEVEKEVQREVGKRIGKMEESDFCSRCGARQRKGNRFCAACGFSLEKARA